jgi:YesN/AraC family two-component response regulator
MPDRILIVDDDDIFREEFKEIFENYGVTEAGNGKEALNILKKPNEIDLVVLDIRMPGLNGIDVLKEIKRIHPSIGIIILTGYGSKDIVVEALRNQSDDYIEKPIDIEKTTKIIERILDSKEIGSNKLTSGIEEKLEKIKRFILRNYNKKIGLKDAAKIVCMSPKYLSRVFKQKTGNNFKEFILKIKIEKAKEMLKKTGYTINLISYNLGYQNTESFIRIFTNIIGHTPAQYRKNLNKKNEK